MDVKVEEYEVRPETLYAIHDNALRAMCQERGRVSRRFMEVEQYLLKLDRDIAKTERRLEKFREQFLSGVNDYA